MKLYMFVKKNKVRKKIKDKMNFLCAHLTNQSGIMKVNLVKNVQLTNLFTTQKQRNVWFAVKSRNGTVHQKNVFKRSQLAQKIKFI